MAIAVRQGLGWWWRFDRYELRDGNIRPAPGATLSKYDPWTEFWTIRSNRRAKARQPEYLSLVDLIRRVSTRISASRQIELAPEHERTLLDWCSKNGLLGVLLHVTHSVKLHPRTVKTPDGDIIVMRGHDRVTGAWRTEDFTRRGGEKSYSPGEIVEGFEKGIPLADRDLDDHARVIQCLRLGTERLETYRLDDSAWPEFFPEVTRKEAQTYPFPQPFTEEFWRAYAEPLEVFLAAARLLVDVVEAYGKEKAWLPSADGRQQTFEGTPHQHLEMNALLAPAGATLGRLGKTRMRLYWTPSLLAAYATMFSEDWIAHTPLLCDECGRVFISTSRRVRYCSPRCKNTAVKRRYRHNRRRREQEQAEKLQGKGRTPTQTPRRRARRVAK